MELPPGNVSYAEFGADGSTVVTFCDDGMARTWDARFAMLPRGEAFVREFVRDRLQGDGVLTDEELLILQPIYGDTVDRDVTRRWAPA